MKRQAELSWKVAMTLKNRFSLLWDMDNGGKNSTHKNVNCGSSYSYWMLLFVSPFLQFLSLNQEKVVIKIACINKFNISNKYKLISYFFKYWLRKFSMSYLLYRLFIFHFSNFISKTWVTPSLKDTSTKCNARNLVDVRRISYEWGCSWCRRSGRLSQHQLNKLEERRGD